MKIIKFTIGLFMLVVGLVVFANGSSFTDNPSSKSTINTNNIIKKASNFQSGKIEKAGLFNSLADKELSIVLAILGMIEDRGVVPTTIQELKDNKYLANNFNDNNLFGDLSKKITFEVKNNIIEINTNIDSNNEVTVAEKEYYLNNTHNSDNISNSLNLSIDKKQVISSSNTLQTNYYINRKNVNILETKKYYNMYGVTNFVGSQEPSTYSVVNNGDVWLDSNVKEFDVKQRINNEWIDTANINRNLSEDGTFLNNNPLSAIAVIKKFTNVNITEEEKVIECRTAGATYNQVLNRCEAFTSDACDGNLFDSTTGVCHKGENSACSYLGSDWSWNGSVCAKKPFVYNATAVSCAISSYIWHSIKVSNYSKPHFDIPPYRPTFTQEEYNNLEDEYINTLENNPNNLVGSWFPTQYHHLLDIKDFTFVSSSSSGPSTKGYGWFSETFNQPYGWIPSDWGYANKYIPIGLIPSIHYSHVSFSAGHVKYSYFQATTPPPLKENEWKDIANNYDKKYIFKNIYPTHYEMTGKVKKLDFQVNKDCSLRTLQDPNTVTIFGEMIYTGIISGISNTGSNFYCPQGGTLNQKTCTRIDTATPKCSLGYKPDSQGKCIKEMNSSSCSSKKMSVSPYTSTPYYGDNGICYSDTGLYCKTYAGSTSIIQMPNGKQITCYDNSQTCNDTRFGLVMNYSGNSDKCSKFNYSCNNITRYGLAESPHPQNILPNPYVGANGFDNATVLFDRITDKFNKTLIPSNLDKIVAKQDILINDNFGSMCVENIESKYTPSGTDYKVLGKPKSGF